MPGANSHTCMQTADEHTSINNKWPGTEKALLNTISSPTELLGDRRHTISKTAGPMPRVNSSQESPDL